MAVVDDPDVEVGLRGQAGDGLPHVPGPDDDQPNSRPGGQEGDPALNRRFGPLGRWGHLRDRARRELAAPWPFGPRLSFAVEQDAAARRSAAGLRRVDDDRFDEPPAFLDHLVECAEILQRTGPLHRLREDHHLAAADQAIRPGVIMVEDERMDGRGRSRRSAGWPSV